MKINQNEGNSGLFSEIRDTQTIAAAFEELRLKNCNFAMDEISCGIQVIEVKKCKILSKSKKALTLI